MVHLEQVLARAYQLKGDARNSSIYEQRAAARAASIRRLMWDKPAGVFTDFLWNEQQRTHVVTAATVFPLYFRIATKEQARVVAATLRRELLQPGGLGTTVNVSGQQWDEPNGWAPLQWLAIEGLNAYGESNLAEEIACRWLHKDISAYEASGVLLEKYNLQSSMTARGGGGGEYPLQVGFGWTNGVLTKLMTQYPKEAAEILQQHPLAR
jgi:alpha,alpha-trehalase